MIYNKRRTNERAAKGWRVNDMKSYTEMTKNEIDSIVKRGGDDKRKLNQEVANYLDGLSLSDKARSIIADTDINNMAECFGWLFTAEEVESYIEEYYKD